MIESTTCPACRTDLLLETRAEYEGKTFELYQKLSSRPVNRKNLMECLTQRCKLSESLAHDLIEEIKVDFGVYERDNMIMFA